MRHSPRHKQKDQLPNKNKEPPAPAAAPIDFSSKDVLLLHMLLQGELPIQVFTEQRFLHLRPVVQAVAELLSRGESPPHNPKRVWDIASVQFNAPTSLEEKLKEARYVQPDPIIAQVLQKRLLWEKAGDIIAQQIGTGKYDQYAITQMFERTQTVNILPVRKLTRPAVEVETYRVSSHIRPLDRIIGGFNNELVIVAAPPKQGKSTFFFNLTSRQPLSVTVLYITIADYGYDDINKLMNSIHPGMFLQDPLFFIADLTAYDATLYDVEQKIKECKPQKDDAPYIVVVDRAEKLKPMGRGIEGPALSEEIFSGLRRFAKRYNATIFTDSQIGMDGIEQIQDTQQVSSYYMYGDRTIRQSYMDIFIGVLRDENEVTLFLEGRRQEIGRAHV